MTDLEQELSELLGRKAEDADRVAPPSPPQAVLRRVRRRQAGMLLTAGLVIAALVYGGFAGLQSLTRSVRVDPAGGGDSATPAPGGQGAVLASGEHAGRPWRLVVYEGSMGWCSEIEVTEGRGGGCGVNIPPKDLSLGVTRQRGYPVFLDGAVSKRVARVVVELEDGRTLNPRILEPPAELGAPFNGFLLVLDEVSGGRVSVFDAAGNLLGRQELPNLSRLEDDLDDLEDELGRLEDRAHGPYPRGAFEACPEVAGTLGPDPAAEEDAGRIAVRFNEAAHESDRTTVAALADPSALDLESWATTGTLEGLHVTSSASAADDGLVVFGCGPEVAERSWAVTISDESGTASAGSATFYLVRRSEGWKVWGSY